MGKPGPVKLKMQNPLEALVPFAVVFMVAPPGYTRREAGEKILTAPGALDAEAVLERAGDNAPPQFKGWVCAADRPLPGWVYSGKPQVVFQMAEDGYIGRQKVVTLDGISLEKAFPADGPPGSFTLYSWPLLALYEVSLGKTQHFWWQASPGLRMAIEEAIVRRLNARPGCCQVFSAVLHRAAIPATNDFWTGEQLAKLGPKGIAEMQTLPTPVPEKSHERASWPLFLPVAQVLNHKVAVSCPGVSREADLARRKLIEHGWKVAV